MKDKRAHYDTMNKSQLNQKIYDSASISCIVSNNWPYPPTASESCRQGCRQAGRQIRRQVGRHSLTSLQCYYSVKSVSQLAFVNKAYQRCGKIC